MTIVRQEASLDIGDLTGQPLSVGKGNHSVLLAAPEHTPLHPSEVELAQALHNIAQTLRGKFPYHTAFAGKKAWPPGGTIDAYEQSSCMKTFPRWITSLAAGCLATLGLPLTQQAATVGKHLASPATQATNQDGLSQFQIIIQRNIFDPDRGRAQPNRQRESHIETFSFRGAADKLGKGFDAFFTGDGAPPSGTIGVNGEINGFKVQEINLSEVKLIDTNHEVVILQDQTGLTRQDGGPWSKVFVPASYMSSPQTGKTAGNDNGPDSSRLAVATDDNAGANGGRPSRNSGSHDAGGGVPTTQADTPEPPAPINPAVLARMQTRRAQEN